jgi:hypothetical protein
MDKPYARNIISSKRTTLRQRLGKGILLKSTTRQMLMEIDEW